ncbi:PEGA domain-containing protein [Patescibacteria group bacterium]|nr:PEGA domain-containing protein [Patescibacteria group bacterium]
MDKLKTVLIVLGLVVFIVLTSLFFMGYFKPKGAGILIETAPTADVYINGQQVGRTPFEMTRDPGEAIIKLIPESQVKTLSAFETKVNLVSGIQTVIRREFGETDEDSSGEIISFEKESAGETSLAVVSIPDAAQITIDGKIVGFAPYKTSSVLPGEHQIIITAPNYLEKTLTVNTIESYKLTLVIKLARDNKALEEAEKEKEEVTPPVTQVEILETPTGYLRVRAQPNTAAEEIAQVKPGEKYNFIEKDENTGWYKIEIPATAESKEKRQGWVSNQYSRIIEPESENSSSPSPSPEN